jgi:hypothetical protein
MILMYAVLDLAAEDGIPAYLLLASVPFDNEQVSYHEPQAFKLPGCQLEPLDL